MRDPRFVAVHRGGPLDRDRHCILAGWAADCAEHVLPLFERCGTDARPRHAIAVARAWAEGDVSMGDARRASVEAHAAAREANEPSATAAARAAGHAAATAHMADHCLRAARYACQAVASTPGRAEQERTWQIEQLPEPVRELVISALDTRFTGRPAPPQST